MRPADLSNHYLAVARRAQAYQPASAVVVLDLIRWMSSTRHKERTSFASLMGHGYWPSTEYVRWIKSGQHTTYIRFRQNNMPAFQKHEPVEGR